MTPNKLQEFTRGFQDEQRLLLDQKGLSYSGAAAQGEVGDRLANFKRVAAAMGVRPLQCWLCYFLKHVDSISTFVRTGFESEGFRGRAVDVANYAILGAALVQEEREGSFQKSVDGFRRTPDGGDAVEHARALGEGTYTSFEKGAKK